MSPTSPVRNQPPVKLWLFAAGLFARQPGQMMAQLVGIVTLLGFVFPLVYLLFAILNRIVPFRVDPDGER